MNTKINKAKQNRNGFPICSVKGIEIQEGFIFKGGKYYASTQSIANRIAKEVYGYKSFSALFKDEMQYNSTTTELEHEGTNLSMFTTFEKEDNSKSILISKRSIKPTSFVYAGTFKYKNEIFNFNIHTGKKSNSKTIKVNWSNKRPIEFDKKFVSEIIKREFLNSHK